MHFPGQYITKQQLNRYLLVIYCFAFVLFFAPVVLPLQALKGVSWIIFFLYFIYSVPSILNGIQKKDSYSLILFLWIIIFYYTVPNALFQHQQNPIQTFRMVLELFPLLLFFFFVKRQFEIEDIEKVILGLSFVYILFFCIALYYAPQVLFDNTNNEIVIASQRGIARVKLLGANFVFYSLFLSLGVYRDKRKFLYLLLAVLMLVFIFFTVSRQHIFFSLILGSIFLLRNYPWYVKPIVLAFTVSISFYVLKENEILLRLIELTLTQFQESGIENIRILAAKFFLFEYDKNNILSFFVGHGIPYSTSSWGQEYWRIMDYFGYVLSDVGYVKIYFYWGLMGLIAIAFLFKKILSQKVPIRFEYIKFYAWFILLTNVASHNFFKDIMFVSVILYIHFKVLDEKKKSISKK